AIVALGSEAQNALHRGERDEMNRSLGLWVERDALAAEAIDQLVACQRPRVTENLAQRCNALDFQVIIEAELRMSRGSGPGKDRTQQRNQPAEILRRDDMECPAHQPRSGDRSLVSERPLDVAGAETRAADSPPEGCRAENLRLQPA